MPKRGLLTKILAIGGTVLAWFPILAPIFFMMASLIGRGGFHLDYLMPAELFPLFLAGGLLLLWAAIRIKRHRGLIGWALLAGVLIPVLGQAAAYMTGLATGAVEPTGWQMALLGVFIALYICAIIAVGAGGIRLLIELFGTKGQTD